MNIFLSLGCDDASGDNAGTCWKHPLNPCSSLTSDRYEGEEKWRDMKVKGRWVSGRWRWRSVDDGGDDDDGGGDDDGGDGDSIHS